MDAGIRKKQSGVYDDVTSPCIDAGNPTSDWTEELWPHGGRVNMGAYGGTPTASMSADPIGNIADLNHDSKVGILDLDLLCNDWLYNETLLDTDLNLDGRVDMTDFGFFAGEWLWEQGPRLVVSGNLFSPVAYEGGPNPDPNILIITNPDIGIADPNIWTLNWSITDVNEMMLTFTGLVGDHPDQRQFKCE